MAPCDWLIVKSLLDFGLINRDFLEASFFIRLDGQTRWIIPSSGGTGIMGQIVSAPLYSSPGHDLTLR